MAQREITELPLASTPDGNELTLVRQGINDKKVTLDTIKDYVATELSSTFLDEAANLSDVGDVATARANLGVQTAAEADAAYLQIASNLSDVGNATTAFSNIKQAATTTTSGVLEVATKAEMLNGTDNTRAITPYLIQELLDEMFASQISAFPVGVPPTGWLKCNGAAVSRTTYARLFAKIGTVYGAGNGSTTFNVPDIRGEFPRGFDDGRGVDSGRVLGSKQGESSLHVDEFDTVGGGYTSTSPATIPTNGSYSSYRASGRSHDNNNAGIRFKMNAAETRPRNIALLYCIKY